jgi:hypothetical protein
MCRQSLDRPNGYVLKPSLRLSTGPGSISTDLHSLRQVDETTPIVDGLRLIERTEDAGAGEVWRARYVGGLGGAHGEALPGDLAGVGECFVRVLRLPVDEAIRARAHAVADDLVTLDDPGIVGVREVRTSYDGVALVLTALPSPMLALHLLARRRQLSAGEVVTLGVAVSWALAAAHGEGFTHGRLRDADVLIDPAGRPLLAGVGVMGVLGSAGEPEDDVRALGRMLLSLLDAESAGALKVTGTLQKLPDTANELAAALALCTPAKPIRLDDEAEASEGEPARLQRSHRRQWNLAGLVSGAFGSFSLSRVFRGRRWRRPLRMAGAGAGILVLTGVIGWVSAPGPQAANEHAGLVSAPATNWSAVLTTLDAARARAFARPGTVAISTFDAAGSSAFRYDTAAVASLHRQGAHAQGLRMVQINVDVKQQSAREVTLVVTDMRPSYQVVDAKQQVLSQVPVRAGARHLIVLRTSGGALAQWRIAEVRSAL